MRTLLLAAVAALAVAYASRGGLSLPALPLGTMDGTAWDVRVKPDSFLSFSRRDTLVFARGRLTVGASVSRGLSPAVYSADAAGDGDTWWDASLQDVGRATANWHGLTRGDRIEGTVMFRRPDGSVRRFSSTGRRRPA